MNNCVVLDAGRFNFMPEYRSIQQVKLFLLVMNPMMGRAEDGEIAAISDDYDRLVFL